MKKLILDKTKISFSKKNTNFFLSDLFFILFKNKKQFKYSILNKSDLKFKTQVEQIKYIKKIYKTIIKEIILKLNLIHKTNWEFKTWNFFLGHWLHDYIAVILDRIYLIKSVLKKRVNISDQISIGRNASLISNDLNQFTKNAASINWNNKLMSRILYLITTNNFNRNSSFLILKKKDKNYKKSFDLLFNFKLNILKFFYFFLPKKFVFYNSYIKDKFVLFKIFLRLCSLPLPYTFSFFNNHIVNANIDINLRKKINLDFKKNEKLDTKIIKFLFTETFPKIYLEGFATQKKIAENSFLPKKINGVFTCSSQRDNSFKFWLADKIQNKQKIFYGSHGVGYNMFKNLYHQEHELKISNNFFVWGSKKTNSKMISVGNFLNGSNKFKIKIANISNILIVLPFVALFKRRMSLFFSKNLLHDFKQLNNILCYLKINNKSVYLKSHPKNTLNKLNIINLLELKNKKIKILNQSDNFENIKKNFSMLIFTYMSTEFTNSLSSNRPCMIYLNKAELKNYKKDAITYLLKLHSVGILHFTGKSLALKLNSVRSNINNWWNNKETIKIKKQFCESYCNPNFNYKLMTIYFKK